MTKARTYTLFFLLAVVGLLVGRHLSDAIDRQTPEIVLQVGQHLVTGKVSPDGRYLAGIGRKDNFWFAQVWDIQGRVVMGPQSLVTPHGRFHGFDWHPGSQKLAVSAGNEVWVFQVKNGKKTVLAASEQVRTIEYDGPFLMARARTATFVWKDDKTKPFWRLDQGYLLHSTLNGKTGRLATACFDDGVRVFDLQKKRQLSHFHPGVTSAGLKFDSSGSLLASGFRNRGNRRTDHILVHNLESGKPAGPTLTTPRLFGYQFSTDGRTVVSRQQAGAFVWRVDDGKNIAHREGQSTLIDDISDDGNWVATVPGGGMVRIWSTQKNEEYKLLAEQPVSDVRFSGPGRLLAVGGQATL